MLHDRIQPMTEAERRTAAAAIRARLRGPARVVNIRSPAVKRMPIDARAHVDAYREYLEAKATQSRLPRGYVKVRCFELGVQFDDIMSRSRKHVHVAARHQLISEVKGRFPNLSFPQIGRLFGGIDHTSVLFALKKHGYEPGNRYRLSAGTIAEVKAMYAGGANARQIAEHFGCAVNTVRMHVDPEFRVKNAEWCRRGRENAKRVNKPEDGKGVA